MLSNSITSFTARVLGVKVSPSSSMSQSPGSGSLKLTEGLCRVQQVTIMVHTLSWAILNSECSTWNLLFNNPKVHSMLHLVILCALLNAPPEVFRGWGSRLPHMANVQKIWQSWVEPGHIATTSVDIPAKFNCIQYTTTGFYMEVIYLNCGYRRE